MTPREGFIQANGLRLHYLEWGAAGKPPLVLLHGFGNQAWMWEGFAGSVAERYRVVALDFRGHGDSDHAPEYGDENNAADVLAVCESLGLGRVSLLGFSMGGSCAMILAARRPELIERLVIVDRGPDSGGTGRARIGQVVSQARSVFPDEDQALAYIRLANPRWAEPLVRDALRHAFRAQPDGSYALKYDEKLRERFLGGHATGPDLWACWRAIRCPVLLLRGAESDVLSAETAARMVEMLPNTRFETVPEAGHNVAVDNPPEFNRVVGSFLP